MKNLQQNFNSVTNIFILILLFFGGLSYADTNGVWQFANDTVPGIFGSDEGANISNNYTFINPVYFNLGLHVLGFSTITELHSNLFYANNATIASQLTLTGISNCGVNSKLRTDAFGNVICMPDNVNDGVYNLATMKTAVSNNFHNLGGVDKDTWITTQTCGTGQILGSVGKNSKICVNDTKNYIKDGVSWAEVSGKPVGFADNVDNVNDAVHNFATMRTAVNHNFHNLGGVDRVNDGVHNLATMRTAVNHNFHNLGGVDRVGITREIDPQVRTVISGKLCKGVAGGKIDCTSAAPSSGGSTIVPANPPRNHCIGSGYSRRCNIINSCPTGYSPLSYISISRGSRGRADVLKFCYK